jgi:hypothetical protein
MAQCSSRARDRRAAGSERSIVVKRQFRPAKLHYSSRDTLPVTRARRVALHWQPEPSRLRIDVAESDGELFLVME